ncbi:MAG: trigger factor [Neisseriaceae bacterium]|jgi:trigger factor
MMTIQVLEGLKRKAQFNVSKSDVKDLVQDELKKYAKDVKVPGFRPGKAPQQIVEQMYGGKAYEDALNNQINKRFVDIVIENKIDLVGYPEFDLVNKEDTDAEEFIFSAIFEVMPEVKFNDFSNCEIEKPVCKFDDSIIEKTIDSLRKQRCTYVEANKKAENGDKVTIDFVGTVDDVPFEGGTASDYPFILGQGYMLADFEAGVLDLSVGESRKVEVKFPDTYHAENLKGKTATFNISLKKIEESVLPELNDEFIKSLGVADGTMETLNKEIKTTMENEVNRRIRAKQRENVLNALSNNNPLEVPNTLVHEEIHRMMDNARENMKKQGYPEDKIKLTHDMFKNDAKKFVILRLLVQQYIKENNISVNDDEVKQTVIDMSKSYEDSENYVSWYYSDDTRVANARAIAMEDKVLASIISKSKCKEVDIEYEDLMKLPL